MTIAINQITGFVKGGGFVDDSQPVYIQIMNIIETDIITGVYKENDLIISTTQIAKLYSVNPTTAVKAISKLTDMGILYKKRGIGMCVAESAYNLIAARRKEAFFEKTIRSMLDEAKNLGVTEDEIISLIKEKTHD
jgi:DNA-binding transcriptional regulator YhcF (GntR family)